MRILILGGTSFLGRHAAEEALLRGYHVTLLNRGKTGPELFAKAEAEGRVTRVKGDRARLAEPGNPAAEALRGQHFDAVIDTSGYQAEVVRQSAELLAAATGTYLFVSSISVYAAFTAPNVEKKTEVSTVGEGYGPQKAACEDEVRRAFGPRALISRPGLIVGPYDPTDRFTYWVRRLAHGGVAVAPGDGSRLVQFIDGRDLAMLYLDQCERQESGSFNATGRPLTMRTFLETARAALGPGAAELRWLDEAFLTQHDVKPWMEMTTWLPEDQTIDCTAALDAGLAFRALEDTVRATRAFDLARGEPTPMRAGLTAEREKALLTAASQSR